MKKLLSSALLLLMSVSAHSWTLSEINTPDGLTAGYIYHAGAIGTRVSDKSEKMFTSLRLVCSTKSPDAPMVILLWSGMSGSGTQYLTVLADDKPLDLQGEVWIHENNILYRSTMVNGRFMKALKNSSKISVTWRDGDSTYTTGFDTSKFKDSLSKFNDVCNTRL